MRLEFLGLPIDALTMRDTLNRCHSLIQKRNSVRLDLNASIVVDAQSNPLLREALFSADIVNADGASVVYGGRLLGLSLPERVSGIDLMEELIRHAPLWNSSVFLLGASEDVVSRSAKLMSERGVNVIGYHNGFWSSDDEEKIVALVSSLDPDIVFLALPSPKKEIFLLNHLNHMCVGIFVGIGGSLDVFAGNLKRAPKWMRVLALEWLYRLCQEPRRLMRRYFIGNIKFLRLLVSDIRSRRRRHHQN